MEHARTSQLVYGTSGLSSYRMVNQNQTLKHICPNLSRSRVCYCKEGDYYSFKLGSCIPGDRCANKGTCAQHEGGMCEHTSEQLKCTCPKWLKGDNCQETVPRWNWTEWSVCEVNCGECRQTRKRECVDHRGVILNADRCDDRNGISNIEVHLKQLKSCDVMDKLQPWLIGFAIICCAIACIFGIPKYIQLWKLKSITYESTALLKVQVTNAPDTAQNEENKIDKAAATPVSQL